MSDNRSTLNLVRTISICDDNPTELPYFMKTREHQSNCKSCGAPVPANGICEYCGTDNTLETNKTKLEPFMFHPPTTVCGECKHCSTIAMNGMTYCTAKDINPFTDISTVYVKRDSRPNWCPIKEVHE